MNSNTKFGSLFHNFIESLPFGVIIVDDDGKILEINRNASFMLNIKGSQPINMHYGQLIEGQLRTLFEQLINNTKELGFVMEKETSLSVARGVEVTVAFSGSVLMDDNKSRSGIIIVCREMSARQEIERMHELEKLKSEFISGITHDLKGPIASIFSYTDLLLKTVQGKLGSEDIEYLTIIHQQALRLTRMINDILDVARIESGGLQIRSEQVVIKDIVDEAFKSAAVQKEKFIFTAVLDPQIPLLWLDRELITRVIMNLISNATKYSPNGGEIKVEAYIQQQNVRIDISDQGMGMSDESLAHLFQKFFRVKSAATKEIKGIGLGLVITKGLVESHGGALEVASQLGKGSTFSVILPLSLAYHKPEG
jgi:PAS domain S-box-containing protein